ncbi:MAG: M48 family metalloprotease [Burkholderiales bacterium]
MLSGCASPPKNQIKAFWLPPSQDAWNRVTPAGLTLRYRDGSTRVVSQRAIANMATAREKLMASSEVRADLGLADTQSPNAFAFDRGDRRIIAFSLSWLDALGDDIDAIATTMAHEMAHLHLGHSEAMRNARENNANDTGAVLGTLLSLSGVPLGSAVASVGATALARSYTRDEERAADELGMEWAVASGFDPCGRLRTMTMYQKIGANPATLDFVSTHPGAAERSELANQISRRTRNRDCES